MQPEDIPQVADIEREAFPPPWPATNFRRELMFNKSTRYLVACDDTPLGDEACPEGEQLDWTGHAPGSKLRSLASGLERWFGGGRAQAPPAQLVLGFMGLWFMVDEAHLSNIAVRKAYQQRGVGEHLLIGAIRLAVHQRAQFITLEVRASNRAAQALYRKYGFVEVGVRHGYYTDNKEDAVLMTVEGITSAAFQDSFERLRQAHAQEWGIRD